MISSETKSANGRTSERLNAVALAILASFIPFSGSVFAAEIVQNGSFEMLSAPFVDDGLNYMALGDRSTEIVGWTVSTSTGAIVLGRSPTGDGYTAANGSYFVDLSGYGSSSPDGALIQTIDTVGGATYAFSMDLAGANNGTVSAFVGGQILALTPGTPFVVGGTEWIPETATFGGDPFDTHPVLIVKNESPGSDIDFVDDVSITGPAIPEPSTWAMLITGFAALGFAAYRFSTKSAAFPG